MPDERPPKFTLVKGEQIPEGVDRAKIVNVDQAIHLAEQVVTHLEGESDGTCALFLALYHEHVSKALSVTPGHLSKLAAALMTDPEFRDHLKNVAAAREAARIVEIWRLDLNAQAAPEAHADRGGGEVLIDVDLTPAVARCHKCNVTVPADLVLWKVVREPKGPAVAILPFCKECHAQGG